MMKENLDASRPNVKFTFFNQDESGKTMLNILNPDTGSGRLASLILSLSLSLSLLCYMSVCCLFCMVIEIFSFSIAHLPVDLLSIL